MADFLTSHRIELFALSACLGLMGLVFELVRRREMKERYSLLWFCTGTCLLLLTVKRQWLITFASAVGIYYPPSALFLVLNLFMILILIHYSMVLSKLLTRSQKLTQKVALLEADLETLKNRAEKRNGTDEAA